MNKQQNATLEDVVKTLATFYSNNNIKGWNEYPIYVVCEDGETRKVKTIGCKIFPNGWREEWNKIDNKTSECDVKYDGGFYLLAEL